MEFIVFGQSEKIHHPFTDRLCTLKTFGMMGVGAKIELATQIFCQRIETNRQVFHLGSFQTGGVQLDPNADGCRLGQKIEPITVM